MVSYYRLEIETGRWVNQDKIEKIENVPYVSCLKMNFISMFEMLNITKTLHLRCFSSNVGNNMDKLNID